MNEMKKIEEYFDKMMKKNNKEKKNADNKPMINMNEK